MYLFIYTWGRSQRRAWRYRLWYVSFYLYRYIQKAIDFGTYLFIYTDTYKSLLPHVLYMHALYFDVYSAWYVSFYLYNASIGTKVYSLMCCIYMPCIDKKRHTKVFSLITSCTIPYTTAVHFCVSLLICIVLCLTHSVTQK